MNHRGGNILLPDKLDPIPLIVVTKLGSQLVDVSVYNYSCKSDIMIDLVDELHVSDFNNLKFVPILGKMTLIYRVFIHSFFLSYFIYDSRLKSLWEALLSRPSILISGEIPL